MTIKLPKHNKKGKNFFGIKVTTSDRRGVDTGKVTDVRHCRTGEKRQFRPSEAQYWAKRMNEIDPDGTIIIHRTGGS